MAYSIPNYNPYHPSSVLPLPDPPALPAHFIQAARQAGATCVASDGYYCYRQQAGITERSQWYGSYYGVNWQVVDRMPEGVIKL